MPTSSAQFTVVYDGEALRGSQMDVRDLAPALLALGDVLEEANRVLNGDRATVSIHVKAFQSGCFGINFETVQSCYQAVKNFLAPGSDIRDTLEILNALGFTPKDIVAGTAAAGYGLYALIKRSRGKKPKSVKKLENNNVRITFEYAPGHEEDITVSSEVSKLFADSGVREAVAKSIEPLKQDGIDSFSVEQRGEREVLVTSADVEYYQLPVIEPQDIPVDETPRESVLSIVSLSFKEDNKWRLSDGSAVFNVKITDKSFLHGINEGTYFAKGDLLKVKLVSRATYAKDGLKTEYEVVKVLEHIQRPRQLWLQSDK